jgi:hypothetical protein
MAPCTCGALARLGALHRIGRDAVGRGDDHHQLLAAGAHLEPLGVVIGLSGGVVRQHLAELELPLRRHERAPVAHLDRIDRGDEHLDLHGVVDGHLGAGQPGQLQPPPNDGRRLLRLIGRQRVFALRTADQERALGLAAARHHGPQRRRHACDRDPRDAAPH